VLSERGHRLGIQPALSPLDLLLLRPSSAPFPLNEASCRAYRNLTDALSHGLHALGLQPGDQVLVPALHNASVVDTLVGAGLTCLFFDGIDGVHPDAEELNQLCSARTRCLYLTHFLGFPQNAERWRTWCDEHEVKLIEDATQFVLTSDPNVQVGRRGDVALFSLAATTGVPNVALLVAHSAPPAETPTSSTTCESKWSQRRQVAQRVHLAYQSCMARWPQLCRWAEMSTSAVAFGAPLPVAPSMFAPLVDPSAAAWRRLVYGLLEDQLAEHMPGPFRRASQLAAPWVFPCRVDDPTEAMAKLRTGNVEATPLWPPHSLLDPDRYPHSTAVREGVIGLPAHQRLRVRDVDRIATAVLGHASKPDWRLELFEDFDSMRADWEALASRSGNPFLTWEWMSLWWRHFGGEARLRLVKCRRSDESVAAILPLCLARWRGGITVMRFVGHLADELGPVCPPDDRTRATLAVRRLVRDEPEADLVLLERLGGGAEWARLLEGRLVSRVSSPELRRYGRSWAEVRSSLSRNLRQDMGRKDRRLRRRHKVVYQFVDDAEQLPAAFDALEQLHKARWGHEGQVTDAQWRFYREFARTALDRGWLRLWVLHLDDEPVAAILGFRYGGDEWFVQTGRDPELEAEAVGFVLLAHAVRMSMLEGVEAFRFLRGDEPYKRRFSNSDDGLATVAMPTSVVGAVLGGGLTVARKLPPEVRLRVARKVNL